MRTRTPALAVMLLIGAALAFGATQAEKLYQEGRRAELRGKIVQAYLLYARAAALDPDNQMYWLRSQALRTRAAREAKVAPKAGGSATVDLADLLDDADEAVPEADAKDLLDARKPLPPTEMTALAGRRDFDLRGDSKTLFEEVARAWGLDVVFDGDYQPGKPLHFEMQQADYRESLHALEAVTGSFIVPLAPRLFLVAKDTQQKRNDVEPAVAISVPVPETSTTQDMAALITAVQQASGLQKVSWDNEKHMVILRGPISRVLPARALFEELMRPRAQVDIELEFLELTRTDMTSLGLQIPDSFPIFALGNVLGNVPSLPQAITKLMVLGGGDSLVGIGVADPSLIARMSKSRGQLLLHTEMRASDGTAATLHVGDKYPVMTAGYFGPASFQGPNAYTPPPAFNFEDLGLTIKATPKVHGSEGITLDLESEFKVLAGAAINGIPIISNRSLKSTIRLPDGQWAVIAGLMQTQEARTIAGLAGLNRIPLLGWLTNTHTNEKDDSAVLLLLRPRLVSAPPDEAASQTFWMGSETRPLTPL